MNRRIAPAALVAGVALLCAAPAVAGAPRTKTIKLFDNYYLPLAPTVKAGTTVAWKWPTDAIDVHDVKLKSGPRGAGKFKSEAASSGFTFKRKLTVPGTYKIVCTLHEEMTMLIKVRR